MTIFAAKTEDDMAHVRELFREYQVWLDADICFQGFEEELNALPGIYAPPLGRLYLISDNASGEITGCAAVCPRENGRCELKRLFVREAWQGRGLGRELVRLSLQQAKRAGHSHMCLDTLDKLAPAIALYKSMGFREIDTENRPVRATVRHMEITLP